MRTLRNPYCLRPVLGFCYLCSRILASPFVSLLALLCVEAPGIWEILLWQVKFSSYSCSITNRSWWCCMNLWMLIFRPNIVHMGHLRFPLCWRVPVWKNEPNKNTTRPLIARLKAAAEKWGRFLCKVPVPVFLLKVTCPPQCKQKSVTATLLATEDFPRIALPNFSLGRNSICLNGFKHKDCAKTWKYGNYFTSTGAD